MLSVEDFFHMGPNTRTTDWQTNIPDFVKEHFLVSRNGASTINYPMSLAENTRSYTWVEEFIFYSSADADFVVDYYLTIADCGVMLLGERGTGAEPEVGIWDRNRLNKFVSLGRKNPEVSALKYIFNAERIETDIDYARDNPIWLPFHKTFFAAFLENHPSDDMKELVDYYFAALEKGTP